AGVFAFAARAWNKVRFPALMTVFLGVLNFAVLYLLASFADKNISYINWMLLVGLIFGLTQSYLLNGLYFSKFYKGTRSLVLINFCKILIVVVSVYFITAGLSSIIQEITSTIL